MNLSKLLLLAISCSLASCRVIQYCDCPDTRSTVCGVDQKTYSNRCQARCQGVEVECTGECVCEGPDIGRSLLGSSASDPSASSSGTCLKNKIFYDHGEVTAYGTDPSGGHCGFKQLPSEKAKKYFVAISSQDPEGWKDGAYCGSCVRLKYTDGKELIGYISDSCPSCPKYHWDLSNYLYLDLTSEQWIGIEDISEAQIVECPDDIVSGNMKIKTKEGSNPWWSAYQVLNTKIPINGMSMSTDGGSTWTKMAGPGDPAPSGFWFMKPAGLILNADNGMENYKIRVESDTGDIVVDMVGVVDGGETDAETNNGGGENCPASAPGPGPAPVPGPSGGSAGSCDSLVVDQNSWTGNMQGNFKTVLASYITSYTIIIETDVPLTNIQFWEADASPTTGNSFTVTNKNWFGGKKAGENLELGFQMTFSGTTNPSITFISLNNVSLC